MGGMGCCRRRQLVKPATARCHDSASEALTSGPPCHPPLQGQPHVAVAAVHGHEGVLDVLCEHGGAVTLKALHHATDTRSIRVVWVGLGRKACANYCANYCGHARNTPCCLICCCARHTLSISCPPLLPSAGPAAAAGAGAAAGADWRGACAHWRGAQPDWGAVCHAAPAARHCL